MTIIFETDEISQALIAVTPYDRLQRHYENGFVYHRPHDVLYACVE
jgi:hypothetical protein